SLHTTSIFTLSLHDALPISEVRGHHDDDVVEQDLLALVVAHLAVVEDAEQDVEHVRMRFFDFIQQQDRVRALADAFGQGGFGRINRKSTRLNSSHVKISYAV